VVLRATHDGVRMLLAGDIERPAQQALLDSGVDLHAEVLKQPHHGSSKLLPRFVDAVGAEVAVIGVGVGNDYGHPAPAALQRDHDAGIATILRTDTDGDVQIVGSDAGLGAIARGPRRASAVR
jgi:competence protein ComEC